MAASKVGGIVSNIASLFQLMFKFWGIFSITLIIVLFTTGKGIYNGIQEKSFEPVVREIGNELIKHDVALGKVGNELQEKGGIIEVDSEGQTIWTRFLFNLSSVLKSFWYLFFFLVLFYKFSQWVIIQNESEVTKNLAVAVVIMVIFQIGANLISFDGDTPIELDSSDSLSKFMPFKGLVQYVKSVPYMFKTVPEGTWGGV